jgi:DUF4097 and DUF4098 domain-containing protein YvlB
MLNAESFPMKLPSLFAVLALFATVSVARAGYNHKEAFAETHPFKATGEITLVNANGAIVIRTWDRAEVRIEGEKSAQTEEELKQIGLTIDVNSGTLSVKTDFPRRSGGWFGGNTIRAAVKLTVTVPATVEVRQVSAVNGSVTIDGVRGKVTARTVNGGVTTRDLGADASLQTVNGSIRAEFASLAATQKISARTVNGSTTVKLPRDASVALEAHTVNGSVSCDFPIRLEGKSRRSSLKGTIGAGAATLLTNSVNGSVRVSQL